MKRFMTWMLSCVLLLTSFAGTVAAQEQPAAAAVGDTAYQTAAAKLKALDMILPEKEVMTLAEYTGALAEFLQIGQLETAQIPQFANERGLFTAAGDFGGAVTYAQTVEAALKLLGFEYRISYAGGGEAGAVSVADSEKINSGITATANSFMGSRAVTVLFANLLELKLMDSSYNGEIFQVQTSEETVLEKYFGLEEKRVEVLNADRKNKTVTVLEAGQVFKYSAADSFDFDNITIGNCRIWTDEDRNIYYVKVPGGSYVFYDYIYSVNGSEREDDLFYPAYLKEMEFYNTKTEYDIAEGAILYYNEEPVQNKPYAFRDCFARVMVVGNEIVAMDLYSLFEGGLIYATDAAYIRYTKGEISENVLQDLTTVANITVIIDGKKAENGVMDLKPEMVFDFWLDAEEENMFVVASSRKAYGAMNGYSSEEMRIEKTKYVLSDKLYVYSTYLGRYQDASILDTMSGECVTAYLDDRGEVRYVEPDTESSIRKTVYGIVYRAWEDDADPDIRTIKLIPILGPGAGEEMVTYPVKETLSKDSLPFEYAKSVASNLEGKGFLKFTINGKGEISKIEPVEHFGEKSVEISNYFDTTTYVYGGLYLRYAKMIYIYETDEGFCVKTGTYEDLRKKDIYDRSKATIRITADYDPLENPLPRFGVVTGDLEYLDIGWPVYGFVNELTEREEDYKMVFGQTTYSVSKKFVEENDLKKGSYLRARLVEFADEPIAIEQHIDLSGPIDEWKDILERENGKFNPTKGNTLYQADQVLLRSTEYMQFMIDGKPTDVFGFGNNCGIYEIKDGRIRTIEPAPTAMTNQQWFQGLQALENIAIGDRVWFTLSISNSGYTHISNVYYSRDSILPR